MDYRIGVDVGGTNTDAVIIDKDLNIINSIKVPTTEDVSSGIYEVVESILKKSKIDKADIKYAMLGTTQCTNAIVERKKLCRVGIIRLGAPATLSIEPMVDWPEDLKKAISENYIIAKGGYEFDGKEISEIDENEITEFVKSIKGKVDAIAITCVFSPIKSEHEKRVKDIVEKELGDIHISISSEVASMGLLERENATILNSALTNVAKTVTDGFKGALKEEGVNNAEVYLCQNDGTVMSAEYAEKFPILTVACGPTNSIRGASFLSNIENALVVDIGGTTSDIGVIVNKFPRESSLATDIGGARTNFRMPDVTAIGLGGGTIIRNLDGKIKVGPDSVGYMLTEKALVFGGDVLTATDVVVRLGMANIGDESKVNHIDLKYAEDIFELMMKKLEDGIDRMKTSSDNVEIILVGGGGVIVGDKLKGVKSIVRPNNYAIANAIGSAIAQVSGTYEKLYALDTITREEAVEDAKSNAAKNAMKSGAKEETLEFVDIEDIPLAYYPGNATRIKVKCVGDLNHK